MDSLSVLLYLDILNLDPAAVLPILMKELITHTCSHVQSQEVRMRKFELILMLSCCHLSQSESGHCHTAALLSYYPIIRMPVM